jgi:hypothetical protein
MFCRLPFGPLRWLLALIGLSWLVAPAKPRDDAEMERWRQRRRRFRSRVREAVRELLAEDGTEA